MDLSANTTHFRDELAELKNREQSANEGLSVAERLLKRRREFEKKSVNARKVEEETPRNTVKLLAVPKKQYPLGNFESDSTHALGKYTMVYHPLGIDVTNACNAYPPEPLRCFGSGNTHQLENYNFITMTTHPFSIDVTNSYNELLAKPLGNFKPEKCDIPAPSVKKDPPCEDFTRVLPYRMSKAMKEKKTTELDTYLNSHPQHSLGNFELRRLDTANAAKRSSDMKTDPPFEDFTRVLPYRMSKAMQDKKTMELGTYLNSGKTHLNNSPSSPSSLVQPMSAIKQELMDDENISVNALKLRHDFESP